MFWKENKNEIVKIFDNKDHYEKMHNRNDIGLQYINNFEKISKEELNEILDKYLKLKNLTIKELKKDNKHLEELVDYFKDLFGRLVNFIKHKMFDKDKEREDY